MAHKLVTKMAPKMIIKNEVIVKHKKDMENRKKYIVEDSTDLEESTKLLQRVLRGRAYQTMVKIKYLIESLINVDDFNEKFFQLMMARIRYKLFLDDDSIQQPETHTKSILINENVLKLKIILLGTPSFY